MKNVFLVAALFRICQIFIRHYLTHEDKQTNCCAWKQPGMFAVKTDRSAQRHIQYANSNVLNRESKYTYKIKKKNKLLGKALPPCLNFLQTDLSSRWLAGQCPADLDPYQFPLALISPASLAQAPAVPLTSCSCTASLAEPWGPLWSCLGLWTASRSFWGYLGCFEALFIQQIPCLCLILCIDQKNDGFETKKK